MNIIINIINLKYLLLMIIFKSRNEAAIVKYLMKLNFHFKLKSNIY